MYEDAIEEQVNRCECLGKSFAQLCELDSLDAAIQAGAGRECEGCLPYLKLAFATGETTFELDDPRLKANE